MPLTRVPSAIAESLACYKFRKVTVVIALMYETFCEIFRRLEPRHQAGGSNETATLL